MFGHWSKYRIVSKLINKKGPYSLRGWRWTPSASAAATAPTPTPALIIYINKTNF